MRAEKALEHWLEAEILARGRPHDPAARKTADLFYRILLEDHRIEVDAIEEAIEDAAYVVVYRQAGEPKRAAFDRYRVEALLRAVEGDPKYGIVYPEPEEAEAIGPKAGSPEEGGGPEADERGAADPPGGPSAASGPPAPSADEPPVLVDEIEQVGDVGADERERDEVPEHEEEEGEDERRPEGDAEPPGDAGEEVQRDHPSGRGVVGQEVVKFPPGERPGEAVDRPEGRLEGFQPLEEGRERFGR
ncbi:MAG: hypothetical protein KM312_04715 [Hydrogenibacillus schlegelii]|uniref:Uncharacterized protein n=1 Tax=Hydrogenibacillus schlegelii TaxID=1484 RepID=A0A2T5GFD3_HYDSH|nr:hypothetical protein [Hydrogenibacillus schlegelii]MBT9281945.1 hypothetical protein [Hydrogenibacillus schlegelii]PTQ54870.1 MAG: hypothetical protein HSCHL_1813 [Hydrogenibacillus schlegelii]